MPLPSVAAALACLVLTLGSWLTFCCGAVPLCCLPAAHVMQAREPQPSPGDDCAARSGPLGVQSVR